MCEPLQFCHSMRPSQNFCGYDLEPSEWGKIFVNETTEKELISKTYKQFMKLDIKITNNQKWVEDQNRYFSKEDV